MMMKGGGWWVGGRNEGCRFLWREKHGYDDEVVGCALVMEV